MGRTKNKLRRGEAALRLQVRDGLTDELRLEVPASWIGPFLVDPPASLRHN